MEKYFFDGVSEPDYEESKNLNLPLVKYYGSPNKRLVYRKDRDPDQWEIWNVGIKPTFYEEPKLLDKKAFIISMKNLGVSDDLLNRFFSEEVDFS